MKTELPAEVLREERDFHLFTTSKIAPEINRLAAESSDADIDPGLDQCGVANGPCHLSTGIEHLFVAMTGAKIFADWNKSGRQGDFHELVFSPNIRMEAQGGFDLSVGHYRQRHRLRFMHKLLSGNSRRRAWVDEAWVWCASDANEIVRARTQLGCLVANYEKHRMIEPFFVLHVCFCIHEYRRMGAKAANEMVIPSFEDHRRTVIVDLRAVSEIDDWRGKLNSPTFDLKISFEPKSNCVRAEWKANGEGRELPAWTFDKLLSYLKQAA